MYKHKAGRDKKFSLGWYCIETNKVKLNCESKLQLDKAYVIPI